jgi:predicted transcriptional regulator
MAKQTTVRLPDDLADKAEVIARTRGTSVNQLIIDSLVIEIDRVRSDTSFMSRAKELVERDKEILDALAKD